MIDLTDITKIYTVGETQVRALDGISLHIKAGVKWLPSWGHLVLARAR